MCYPSVKMAFLPRQRVVRPSTICEMTMNLLKIIDASSPRPYYFHHLEAIELILGELNVGFCTV
jgi:hypothetical protein